MAANYMSLPLRRRHHVNDQFLVVVVLLYTVLWLPTSSVASETGNLMRLSSNDDSPSETDIRVSPTMALVLICIISTFFVVGCISVYIRQCIERRMSRGLTLDPDGVREGRRRTARGLDAAVIDSFPTFKYSEVKGLKLGRGVLECAVCLNEFEDDETLRLLPECDHVFHRDCIDGWLSSHSTCPVCRANLVPKPGELPSRGSVPPSPVDSDRNDSIVNTPLPFDNTSSIPTTSSWNYSRQAAPRLEGLTGKFMRSFSTSHVLVRPGDDSERFTLRLPVDVRDNLVRTNLQRTKSCVAFPRARSSRRGYRSRSGVTSRCYEGFEGELVRPDRWGV